MTVIDAPGGADGTASGIRTMSLVDADSHINEPPDLWTSRVSKKFRERVPVMKRFDEGDAWVIEGVEDPINFGNNVAAGLPKAERSAWVHWENIRKGGYDPSARLAEMDEDLIDAGVLFPTPRLTEGNVANQDAEFHLALIKAYNDWLSEFCAHDPSRLGGIALVPNRGVKQAVAEVRRIISLPGIVGALMVCYPHGDLSIAPEDDEVWAILAEAGLPLHIHFRMRNEFPTNLYSPQSALLGQITGDLRFLDAPVRVLQFVHSGVFERFPGLQLVMAEVDAGWLPYVKEQADNRFMRRNFSEIKRRPLPSTIIDRHVSFTFITDNFALRNRAEVGVDRLMWSTDFPHSGSDWPNSWKVVNAAFAGIPGPERDAILSDNARRLYRFA